MCPLSFMTQELVLLSRCISLSSPWIPLSLSLRGTIQDFLYIPFLVPSGLIHFQFMGFDLCQQEANTQVVTKLTISWEAIIMKHLENIFVLS